MRNTSLCLAMVLLAAIGQADAGMITQIRSFSGMPTFTRTLTFAEFDDQGGLLQLTSIEVIHELNVDGGQIIIDNDGEDPANGLYMFGAMGSIASTDVALIDVLSQPVTAQLSAVYSDPAVSLAANVGDVAGDFDPSGPDGMQYNGVAQNDQDNGLIDPAVWGQYIGIGTYNIDASALTAAYFMGVGGVEVAYTPVDARGEVTVIYNYIPEPATMCMLAIGGVALLRRRNRK